jgi:hypothetical protein
MSKIKLFEEETFLHLVKSAKRNKLAQKILNEIEARNLIRKKQEKTAIEISERERKDRDMNAFVVRKSLPIRIYSRHGVIQYQYPYPFTKGGKIEQSTRVRLKQGSTFLSKGNILVHPGISYLASVTSFESVDLLLIQSRAFPELEFLFHVDDPIKLVNKLSVLDAEHSRRLYEETKKLISEHGNINTITKMKSRLLAYHPRLYEMFANEHRVRDGKEPILSNLSELLRLERMEARTLKSIKKKRQFGKQNKRTKS